MTSVAGSAATRAGRLTVCRADLGIGTADTLLSALFCSDDVSGSAAYDKYDHGDNDNIGKSHSLSFLPFGEM